MADPKYAALPGIAHDQADVYETHDLPESDQHLDEDDLASFAEDTSSAVETLHLSVDDAFGKFKDKRVDAQKVDFSDRLKPSKQRKGYITWSGDLEMINSSPSAPETPSQKFLRLQCEVRELWEEVSTAAASGSKTDKSEDSAASMSQLAQQVGKLQDELSVLQLEKALGVELPPGVGKGSSAGRETLMSHLEKVKQLPSGSKAAAASGHGGDGQAACYELFMRPENAKLSEGERVASLDKRLAALEAALGARPDAMASLSLETNQKSVMGAIAALSRRTALLDGGHLDHVEGRLAALLQKMTSIAERKQTQEDSEKMAKLNTLYDLVQKSEAMGAALPELVDRLDALQGLHEKALEFSKTLSHLESVQQRMNSNLGSGQTLLKETQTKVAENATNIQANFKNLEERMAKVSK